MPTCRSSRAVSQCSWPLGFVGRLIECLNAETQITPTCAFATKLNKRPRHARVLSKVARRVHVLLRCISIAIDHSMTLSVVRESSEPTTVPRLPSRSRRVSRTAHPPTVTDHVGGVEAFSIRPASGRLVETIADWELRPFSGWFAHGRTLSNRRRRCHDRHVGGSMIRGRAR